MCLMDVPDPGQALREACRVLKPGGFLQFSICHPCFTTPHRRQVRDEAGRTLAIEVGDYFRELNGEMSEWIFSAAPHEVVAGLPRFKVPQFTRTISQWLNLTIDAGFAIERVGEAASRRRGGARVAQRAGMPRWWLISCTSARASRGCETGGRGGGSGGVHGGTRSRGRRHRR